MSRRGDRGRLRWGVGIAPVVPVAECLGAALLNITAADAGAFLPRLAEFLQRRAETDYIFHYWSALGWTVLTLGIYSFYVFYQLVRRMRDHNARRYGWPGGSAGAPGAPGCPGGIIGGRPPPMGPGPASDSVSFWT